MELAGKGADGIKFLNKRGVTEGLVLLQGVFVVPLPQIYFKVQITGGVVVRPARVSDQMLNVVTVARQLEIDCGKRHSGGPTMLPFECGPFRVVVSGAERNVLSAISHLSLTSLPFPDC